MEILHQVSDGEIRRIALAVVAIFLAGLKSGNIRHRELFARVAAALEDRTNQILVLPGEAAKQDCRMRSLVRGKRPLYGTMEMFGLIEASNLAQARTLGFQTLLDFRIVFDLDEIRRHVFLRR